MKKLSVLILTLAMCASLITVQAAEEENTNLYTDVTTEHWAYSVIETSKNLGVFSGYPDGDFRPENNITRAEAVKVACLISGKEPASYLEGILPGVNKEEWYAPYIYALKNIIPSRWLKDNDIKPDEFITREDAIYLTAASLGYVNDFDNADTSVLDAFSDKDDISEDVKAACAYAVANGIAAGFPNGTLMPGAYITRSEFTKLICTASGIGENEKLNWSMDNVVMADAVKTKKGLAFIKTNQTFDAEFTVDADGYYELEIGYNHDAYETYIRFDNTYADGTAGGFMQGLLHGKNKIAMNVFLKQGLNKLHIRFHSGKNLKVYYIKNNGAVDNMPYELSPKNEKYFMDSPKEVKTVIKNYKADLVKVTDDNGNNLSFEVQAKDIALKDTMTVPDDFYAATTFVTLKNEDIEKLGEGTHKLCYQLEGGTILEQELSIAKTTPETELKIINFSVDKANSTLIMLPNGKNLLVDSATKAMAQSKLIPFLQEKGIKLDYYLLTHFHTDHNGLKAQILKDHNITSPDTDTAIALCENGTKEERYAYLKDFGYLDSKMLCFYDEIHKIWDLGGVEIDVTNSRYTEDGEKSASYNYPYMSVNEHNYENATSVSFFLNYNGFRYFNATDNYDFVTDRIMSDMIKMGRKDELRSHWYYGNHHFINGVDSDFINTLNPCVVYIPGIQLERRGAYWHTYKEGVENYYFANKRLADTLASVDNDNALICVNSADDWYYETFRYPETTNENN